MIVFDQNQWAVWAFSVSVNQDNVAAQNVVVTITVPNGAVLIPFMIKTLVGTVAGARTVNTFIEDSDGNTIALLSSQALDSNQPLYHPFLPDVKGVSNDQGLPFQFILSGTDRIEITGAAMAQSEDLKIIIRALVSGRKPTVAYGTDDTPTVAYDRVQ